MADDALKVLLPGVAGRMGGMLLRAVTQDARACLVGASEREGSPRVGADAGRCAGLRDIGVPVRAELCLPPEGADVIIDFTTPTASLQHAAFAAKHGVAMVIGTTGFDEAQLRELRGRLAAVPVVMAANYSVGVNLALALIEQAARILRAEDYDAEIFEAHHRHKVDAPSGTALAMGRALARGRDVALDDVAVYAREGITGARESGSIGFSVMRAGNIVGEHRAMFVSDEECLEIRHLATDRMVFARGALRAAHWLRGRPAGWYGMGDVLSLHD